MCWWTSNEKYTVKKTAEQDIPVFKIVTYYEEFNTIRSFYYGHGYKIGEIYLKTEPLKCLKVWGEDSYIINAGFHSYSKHCSYEISSIHEFDFLCVNSINDVYLMCEDLAIMHCIIPKGSEYYENEKGGIVSNQLKPISIEGI